MAKVWSQQEVEEYQSKMRDLQAQRRFRNYTNDDLLKAKKETPYGPERAAIITEIERRKR
jgi:hypothetical protein